MKFELERKLMARVVKSMFDRWLTNAAGGNLSMRVSEDYFIMTPTLMAEEQLCDVNPEAILVVDKDLNIIEGVGKTTREINMHMTIYREDPRINAVIHAHPKELMVYATMGIDMPLICENVTKYGKTLKCLDYAPATTLELAEKVKEFVREDIIAKGQGNMYSALLQGHGIIVAGPSLTKCNDTLERLETNAYTHLQSCLLQLAGYENKNKNIMGSDE